MRLELPEAKSLRYEVTMQIRWGDMDMLGHVNNTVYLRYMENARIEWFRELGLAPDPDGHGLVLMNVFCNFIRQLSYPGEVLARQYVGAVGRSSIDTFTTLELVDDPGVIYASGGATLVWVDFKEQVSMPLPDAVRTKLTGIESSPLPI